MASTFVGFPPASVVLPRLPIGGARDGLAFLVRLQKAEMGHNLTTCSPAMSCHGLGLHDVLYIIVYICILYIYMIFVYIYIDIFVYIYF